MPEDTRAEEVFSIKQVPIDADLARNILWRFLTEENLRIAFATKNREAMHASVKAGKEPLGHRVEFVVNSSNFVIAKLLELAKTYNDTYPYDTVLLSDFLDIIATSRARFLHTAGIEEKDE
jgi:hypothetical protein